MPKIALISDLKTYQNFSVFLEDNLDKVEELVGNKIKFDNYYPEYLTEAEQIDYNFKKEKIISDRILESSEYDIIIDLSKSDKSFAYLKKALTNNKIFIASNSKLIAENFSEIKKLLENSKGKFFFSAAFSPLPLENLINNFYLFDEIKEINAVLNSTTNYILTEMEKDTISMKETLEEAKDLSFAEKNPDIDLNGLNTLYKIFILLKLVYNFSSDINQINPVGIKGITSYDLIYADELGYKIKLIATAKKEAKKLLFGVRPLLIKKNNFLATINNNDNGIEIISKYNSKIHLKAENNINSVFNLIFTDLVRALNIKNKELDLRKMINYNKKLNLSDLYRNKEFSFYIRIQLKKNEEIIDKLKEIFSEKNIADLILHDNLTETPLLPVIIISKEIREKELKAILKEVENLEGVLTVNNIIAIQK